jgi:hypothetical protein
VSNTQETDEGPAGAVADEWIGIYPPGYEERRRQRLKEKYGLDINPVKATVDGST